MSRTIDLHPDEEGPVATTVVVHVPEDDPAMGGPGRPLRQHPDFVFLAIHGWNDYFYQVELARAVSAAGGRFYAVDLRKYGRSLREGQTFGFIRDLASYDEEIHACTDLVYEEHRGRLPLVIYGHSTGGLVAALWADRHPGAAHAGTHRCDRAEVHHVETRSTEDRQLTAQYPATLRGPAIWLGPSSVF